MDSFSPGGNSTLALRGRKHSDMSSGETSRGVREEVGTHQGQIMKEPESTLRNGVGNRPEHPAPRTQHPALDGNAKK